MYEALRQKVVPSLQHPKSNTDAAMIKDCINTEFKEKQKGYMDSLQINIQHWILIIKKKYSSTKNKTIFHVCRQGTCNQTHDKEWKRSRKGLKNL